MSPLPSVDDLRLALAVARTSSIGAAARELQVSQPSASQRLGRLERQIGVRLFERDTRGARPTTAGRELVAQARHILGHLDHVYDATLAAAAAERLSVGTFASLDTTLFPVLDELLGDLAIDQRVDHGDVLVDWVAEGSMDAAFIAIADQLTLPRGITATTVGRDELVLFLPAGVPAVRRAKAPLKGRRVVFSTYDLRSDELRTRLIALGADAHRGGTLQTTLAIARRRGNVALVPRSAVSKQLLAGERVHPAPFRHRLTLSVVTGPRPAPAIVRVLPRLRRELGLTAAR
jgi:DNA-binding transcriptional LysR family regulator